MPHQSPKSPAVSGTLPIPRGWIGRPLASRNAAKHQVADPYQLFHCWAAFAGLIAFATWMLWHFDVWYTLLSADPTYITASIVVIFFIATGWCGHRSLRLSAEREQFNCWCALMRQTPGQAANALVSARNMKGAWALNYLSALHRKGTSHWRDNGQLTEILAEESHGPHEMAWWVNGILLKMGLLGKVIGFSVLALQIGSMDSFDATQSQVLLKNLTGGLGIALLTTMSGLAGNMLLGLQLMRLDRFADTLVADAVRVAESELGALIPLGDIPAESA